MSHHEDEPERRRHPRAMADLAAVVYSGGQAHAARLVNLSLGGALLDLGPLAARLVVNAGDSVSVDVLHATISPVHLQARVVTWNTVTREVPLLAIEIHEIADEDRTYLEQMISHALTQTRGGVAERPTPEAIKANDQEDSE
jgi:hypothetical protein